MTDEELQSLLLANYRNLCRTDLTKQEIDDLDAEGAHLIRLLTDRRIQPLKKDLEESVANARKLLEDRKLADEK